MPVENKTLPAPAVTTVDAKLTAYIKCSIIALRKKSDGALITYFKTDGGKTTGKNDIEPLKVPGDDATGALIQIRRDIKEREEGYSFKTKEVGKALNFFGGQNVIVDVVAQIWKFDPKDDPGTCRMACDEFDASAEYDGDIEDGGQKHSENGIKLTSLNTTPVQWYWKPTLTPAAP